MKTVKQVAKLTGISVRTLQYYDEIGLLKPTDVTKSGYRLYDKSALKDLQQILFFKELDFKLKDIKYIMENPNYNKEKVFKKQKELICIKRDRLNKLLELLEKLEKGESCMSFKEFDLSEYIQVLEQFKRENTDDVIKNWGSIENFEKFIENVKDKESEVAKMAIKQYGSVEKYTQAMVENLSHFSENVEKINNLKENSKSYIEKNEKLCKELVSDMSKDVSEDEIQQIIAEIVKMADEINKNFNMGENYWNMVIDSYFDDKIIKITDEKYGKGASMYMGNAMNYYFKKEYRK